MERRACLICGSTSGERVFVRRWERPIEFVMCPRCGLVYQSHPPTPGELRRINRAQDETLARLRAERLSHKIRQGRERWRWIADGLGPQEVKGLDSILEIGSGEGTFLEAAQPHVKRVVGIEYNPVWVDYCRGRGLEILEAEWPVAMAEPKFQLVAMFHVVEHLIDPISSLSCVKDVLSSDGCLCVETVDVWRPIGNLQRMFLGPDHIFLLSLPTMEALLAKAGFKVVALDEVELGIRALARPHAGTSLNLNPRDPADLRRLLRRHQVRWWLVAEWREWLKRRRGAMRAKSQAD